MGVKYTVRFVNQSTNSGDVCMFQKDPDLGMSNVFSLAWFTKYAHPSTKLDFRWEVDYSFVWSETGVLTPGVVFDATQEWPTDLKTNNQVTLTYDRGAYRFKDQTKGDREGLMYIGQDKSVPLRQASVGIGMSGAGTFVLQAQPNINLTFTPHPTYWIAFGEFIPGEVLDIQHITGAAQIKFPANVFSMTAILQEDNTWRIAPTASVNAELLEARKDDPKALWGLAA